MNIYDIAKLAGVSIATVSRVVNDSPKVSEKTKTRVRMIMEENGYTPNVFARGMSLNSMRTVGIVCPDVSDHYMAGAVSYLEKNLRGYGYDCILYCSGYEQRDKESCVSNILQKKIDALILVGSGYAGDKEYGEDISYIKDASKEVPVFLLNGYIEGNNIYCVLADDYQAVYEAVNQLIRSGRKKILFLCDSNSYSAICKRNGYEDALRDNGLPVAGERRLYMKNDIPMTRDILLSRRDIDFDAVVATEDGLAAGAVKYARARKLAVPGDICIIGYNNSELALACEPELTSIDGQAEQLCKVAIDSLMDLLQGKEIEHKRCITCSLETRCTTDF